jgi:hypothetical protein
MDRLAWEQEREQLLDQIHRFRISAEGLEVAVVRERKEKEVSVAERLGYCSEFGFVYFTTSSDLVADCHSCPHPHPFCSARAVLGQ